MEDRIRDLRELNVEERVRRRVTRRLLVTKIKYLLAKPNKISVEDDLDARLKPGHLDDLVDSDTEEDEFDNHGRSDDRLEEKCESDSD